MNVEFHFDFGSPNAYLSHKVVPQIEQRTGVKFEYVPILLGGVFKLTNNRSPAESLAGSLSVASSEPTTGPGDDTTPDWEIVDARHLRLRAERQSDGPGRTYTVTVTCVDSAGNATSEQVSVHVPKSRGH